MVIDSRLSRSSRGAAALLARALLLGGAALVFLGATIPVEPVPIHIRWRPDVSASTRDALERELQLSNGRFLGDTTWSYSLLDYSRENIRAIVQHAAVADTHHVDRSTYQHDERPLGRGARIVAAAALFALVGTMVLTALAARMDIGRFWLAMAAVALAVVALRLLPADAPARWLAAAPWLPVSLMLAAGTLAALDRDVEVDGGPLALALVAAPLSLLAVIVVMLLFLTT